jgi:hypothetical protein
LFGFASWGLAFQQQAVKPTKVSKLLKQLLEGGSLSEYDSL